MKLKLCEAAQAVNAVGDLCGQEELIASGVQTDSRLVKPGDLFFCLQGSRFDGHCFAREAAQKKALAVVAHKHLPDLEDYPVLLVNNTLKALGRLARHWRQKCGATVIGITGSSGKTTTKEALAEVLGTRFRAGKNYRNWNNQLGLPLSMLSFSGDEDFWILELGINNPWDMDELGEILVPDAAIILNVGPCHLQGLGDVAGVAAAKARIMDHLQEEHKVFINPDYSLLHREALARPGVNAILFSCSSSESSYRVRHILEEEYILYTQGVEHAFRFPFPGKHLCENLAAVWAVAVEYGLSPEEIKTGLQKVRLPGQRMSVADRGAWTIIDDTYNANPMSMRAALEAARSMAGTRDLFLVLGDMGELGRIEEEAHRDLGRHLASMDFKALFYCGVNCANVKAGLKYFQREKVHQIEDVNSFLSAWNRLTHSGGLILFKGSRKAGMENFLRAFQSRDVLLKARAE